MSKKRFLWFNLGLAGGLALLMVLAACSGEASLPVTATVAAPPTVNGPNRPAPTALPVPTGFPYDCSKIFCFGLAQEPVGILQGWFDPANLVDRPSLQIVRQIYETLFEFSSPGMQAKPTSLLKYPPKISPDGLTYILRLGKGLRFSDDTPLDVNAIKFNFDRWSDPGNLFHKGDFQTWATAFGGFPGNLSSVAVDEVNSTLTIKLVQPMANLFQVLAMPQFSIVAPSAFDRKSGQMVNSNGSGLYALIGKPVHGETKYAALRKNELFYKERFSPGDPAAPVVKSAVIVALVLQQKQEGLDELRRGTIAATDKIRPEQLADAARDSNIVLLDRPALNVAFLGMNVLRPPFDNIIVRQAFASALDTRSLVKEFYYGLGEPASDLLPPAVINRPTPTDLYTNDLDRARRQLEIFGYNASNPLKVDLWVLPVPRAYYPDPHKIAGAVAANLAKINVIVNVREDKEWPEFYKDRLNGSPDFYFYMFGWQGTSGDPVEFLNEFFGKIRGEGGYENPDLSALLQRAATTTALPTRTDLYHQALGIIHDQVPILPLAYSRGVVAVRPNVKGYVPNPTGVESWASVEFGVK